MAFSSESGHWYDRDGKSAHEVPNKSKGGMRPTNIRDAIKLELYPSVTSVLRVLDKPPLNRWIVNNNLMALATLPEIEGETVDARIERAKKDAMEQVKKAAQMGTWIHGGLEMHYSGQAVDEELWPYVKGVAEVIIENCGGE